MNYFSLFGLKEQFELDAKALKSNYQTLQKMTHPDRFVNSSDQEKRLYMQKNAQINDAYSVLSSDISRAEHLLTIRGVSLASEQETVGNVEFLMQQMQWREDLEDANDSTSLQKLVEVNQAEIAEQTNKLVALLQKQESESDQAAADLLREMKFLYKLADEIDGKLDSLA